MNNASDHTPPTVLAQMSLGTQENPSRAAVHPDLQLPHRIPVLLGAHKWSWLLATPTAMGGLRSQDLFPVELVPHEQKLRGQRWGEINLNEFDVEFSMNSAQNPSVTAT